MCRQETKLIRTGRREDAGDSFPKKHIRLIDVRKQGE